MKPVPLRDETETSRALRELSALNARFIENFVTNDVARHDALLHRDFISISSNGMRLDRAAYLRRWANLFDPSVIIYWDTRDEQITLVGNLALVRATNKHTVLNGGIEETGMTCYTDTYIFEDGRWQCIQAQLTPVLPDYWPPDSSVISVYVRGVLQLSAKTGMPISTP